MLISLIIISGTSAEDKNASFFTPLVVAQMKWFAMGWAFYLAAAFIPYGAFRRYSPFLYIFLVVALVGLFLMPSVHNVHRWYRFSWMGFDMQPSEWAKLILAISLASFLERHSSDIHFFSKALMGWLLVLVPFLLILKQPDLGTAAALLPMSLCAFYAAGACPKLTKMIQYITSCGLGLIVLVFVGIIPHESLRPYARAFMKDYQYERLIPKTYHQKASLTAIGKGGVSGSGFRKASFTKGNFLPAANTDSAFAAFAEQFGFIGITVLVGLFFSLIYLGFRAALSASDLFGRYLAIAITTGLGTHILVNMGMMSGLLPITGVPLVLVTYGGSSVLSTMTSLGVLQSIYARRYRF